MLKGSSPLAGSSHVRHTSFYEDDSARNGTDGNDVPSNRGTGQIGAKLRKAKDMQQQSIGRMNDGVQGISRVFRYTEMPSE